MELQDPYRIAYRFSFPDGSRKEFDLELDADTNALLILHSLAQLLAGEMNSDLGSIRYLFVRDDSPGEQGRERHA